MAQRSHTRTATQAPVDGTVNTETPETLPRATHTEGNTTEPQGSDDEMPPEFTDDPTIADAESSIPSAGQNRDGFHALSLDQLKHAQFDTATRTRLHDEKNVPSGEYRKSQRWTLNEDPSRSVYLKLNDSQPGDQSHSIPGVTAHGRLIVTIKGDLDPMNIKGRMVTPKDVYLYVSPDPRTDPNDPGKWDRAYRLYDQCCKAYLTIHGRELHDVSQLVSFILEDTFLIRLMEGDNNSIPMSIRADIKRMR